MVGVRARHKVDEKKGQKVRVTKNEMSLTKRNQVHHTVGVGQTTRLLIPAVARRVVNDVPKIVLEGVEELPVPVLRRNSDDPDRKAGMHQVEGMVYVQQQGLE